MVTSADVIAAGLYRAGIRHAFGVPGGEVVALIDALERAGIRFVLARHENAAGFMAEGAYHATGAPGLLVATVGPGLANAVNVMANAQQDRVPLILIVGAIPEGEALRYTHQVFDHRAVLRPLVKATFEARAGHCDVLVDKAVRLALDPRPGPVHIDLPVAVASAPHPAPRGFGRGAEALAGPAPGPVLEAAQARVAGAERPILMAGLDVLAEAGAEAAVRAVSARFRVPVVTSYKAKGIVAEDSALSLGGHGLSPKSDALVLPLLRRADAVIACGYDPIEMRAGWQDPWEPEACIEIAHAADRQYLHGAGLAWISGLAAGLEAVFATRAADAPCWPGGEAAAARADLCRAFAAGDVWGPAQALHILNAMKPAGMVATVDSGAHRILMSQVWTCAAAGELLQSTGLCTMGCALPLASGHALADPARRVMAVMGDGCLDMVLGELATLRDLRLPVPVVVLVDGSLALIEMKQRRDGKQRAGVDFGVTDYAAVATALGMPGRTAADAESLRDGFAAALAEKGPSLLAVRIPARAYDGLI